MNILYIGHFTEGSGWSKAATNNVLALDMQGHNVVGRNIRLTNADILDETITPIFAKPLENIDVCIQHVLPHHLCGTSLFNKNIAYYDAGESNTIKHTNWINSLQLMDEVWCPCSQVKNNLVKDGLNNVKIVPHGFDISKYSYQDRVDMNLGTLGYFKFYTVIDMNDRKNIDSTIRCFHSEFKTYEPVELVIKVHQKHTPEDVTRGLMVEKINNIKKQMRIYNDISKYKNDIVISNYLSDEEISSLHKSCDCFVSTSFGEGFSLPSFEAMAYGNTPICSNDGGPKDFIDKDDYNTGSLIEGVYDICNSSNPAFPFINTAYEEWFHPSEKHTKELMRKYYEKRNDIDRTKGLQRAGKFSLDSIGKIMTGAINE